MGPPQRTVGGGSSQPPLTNGDGHARGLLELELNALYALSTAGIALLDENLRFVRVNEQMAAMHGLAVEAHVGRTFEDTGSPIASRLTAFLTQVRSIGEPLLNQVIAHPHSGSGSTSFWGCQFLPLKHVDGDTVGVTCIVQKIADPQEVQSAQARLAAIVDSSSDAIIGKTISGVVTDWNHAAERLFGYTAEEMIGQSVFHLYPSNREAEFKDAVDRIRAGEQVPPFETRRICKNGKLIDVLVTVSPVLDEASHLVGLSAISRDITQRKREQAKLQALNDTLEQRVVERTAALGLLHDVAEATNDAETIADAYHYTLRRVCQFNGWRYGHVFVPNHNEKNLVVAETWVEPGYPHQDKIANAYKNKVIPVAKGLPGRVFVTGEAERSNNMHEDPVLRELDLVEDLDIHEVIAVPITMGDQVAAVMEFCSDKPPHHDEQLFDTMTSIGMQLGRVAERKQGAAELRRSEEKLRLALEGITDYAIFTLDAVGNVATWNSGAEHLFGYAPADVIGQPFGHFFSTRHIKQARPQTLLKQVESEGRAEFESWQRRKNGGRFLAHTIMTVLRDEDSESLGFVLVWRDITEKKQLERSMAESTNVERQQLGRELNDVLGQQLTGISLLTKTLERKLVSSNAPEAEDARELARLIGESHSYVRKLIKGVRPVEGDTGGLMSAFTVLAEHIKRTTGIDCALECEQPVFIEDNNIATQLYYIGQEAVENAVRHANPTMIRIGLRSGKDRITLHIRDNGSGIYENEDDQSRGMGLRIMRYRAGLLNARLEIQRAETGGTLLTCSVHLEK